MPTSSDRWMVVWNQEGHRGSAWEHTVFQTADSPAEAAKYVGERNFREGGAGVECRIYGPIPNAPKLFTVRPSVSVSEGHR